MTITQGDAATDQDRPTPDQDRPASGQDSCTTNQDNDQGTAQTIPIPRRRRVTQVPHSCIHVHIHCVIQS